MELEAGKFYFATKLRVTTDWAGLTGEVAGIIEVPRIHCKTEFRKSRSYFEADGLLPVEIILLTFGNN